MRSEIQAYLKKKGISRAAFATSIGVSPASVCNYINGRRTPRPKILRRIRRVTKGAIDANSFYG